MLLLTLLSLALGDMYRLWNRRYECNRGLLKFYGAWTKLQLAGICYYIRKAHGGLDFLGRR